MVAINVLSIVCSTIQIACALFMIWRAWKSNQMFKVHRMNMDMLNEQISSICKRNSSILAKLLKDEDMLNQHLPPEHTLQ